MKTIIKTFLVIGLCILFSCKEDYDPNKPTTFCRAKDNFVIIVNNPPKDTLLLKKEIEKYVFSFFTGDSLREKESKDFKFYIFKEDFYMNCNFKQGEPYKELPPDAIQHIGYHDEIAQIGIYSREDNSGFYCYWLRSSDKYDTYERTVYEDFKNLDSFFQAKRKEYNIQLIK